MISKYLSDKLALSEEGGREIFKAMRSSFLVYIGNMLSISILMAYFDDIILGNEKSLVVYIIAVVAIVAYQYITINLEYNRTYNTTYKESANMRIEISEKLAKLPMSYFSRHDLSDLSQTIMSDVATIEHAMGHSIPKLGAFIMFIPIISILLIVGNVKLGLAVAIPNLLSLWTLYLTRKYQNRGWINYHKKLRENSESFQETIELSQELKAFNKYEDVKESLYKKIDETEKIHWKVEVTTGTLMVLTGFLGFISIMLVSLMAISMLRSGEINILYGIGYLMAALNLKNTFDGTKEFIAEAIFLGPQIKRIKEIKDAEVQKGRDEELDSFDIEVKDVEFSYKDSKVIDGVSFTANNGEVTALVGPSGCGKSTLLRLISRLYDYDKGVIKIGEKNISELSTESLYKNISIVFQDVKLFNNTIMENIRIGNKDATDEEVKKAARFANCEFIEDMENGYETIIGENGAELSGGQRQRLSIARAFLKDAPIIILDEIASSLDIENEHKIQDSLNKLIKDKTVIIISHRMKSIEKTDKIVVLEEGKVDAIGTHEDLLENSKVYRNLIEKSNRAEEFKY